MHRAIASIGVDIADTRRLQLLSPPRNVKSRTARSQRWKNLAHYRHVTPGRPSVARSLAPPNRISSLAILLRGDLSSREANSPSHAVNVVRSAEMVSSRPRRARSSSFRVVAQRPAERPGSRQCCRSLTTAATTVGALSGRGRGGYGRYAHDTRNPAASSDRASAWTSPGRRFRHAASSSVTGSGSGASG